MHKRRLNEFTLQLTIEPDGPILIKSGSESGADPTLPSMNFVRTRHPRSGEPTIYLPGASLKGVVRSHSERIIRTVFPTNDERICCDPLSRDNNCSSRIRAQKITETDAQYKELCLACRVFGHMEHASHFVAADAYPEVAIDTLPVRHNVAIDRLSGGVAVGPFDMEVALDGRFQTTMRLHNFETWQIGLLALALRDLKTGQVRLGFAKSRGLGAVKVTFDQLEIGYPGQFDAQAYPFGEKLLGVSALAQDMVNAYGFQQADALTYPAPVEVEDDWGRQKVTLHGDEAITNLFKTAVSAWASIDLQQVHGEAVS